MILMPERIFPNMILQAFKSIKVISQIYLLTMYYCVA